MTIEELASLGYACGVATLDEALTMVELHHNAFNVETLLALSKNVVGIDLAQNCADVLGPERCAREDQLLAEALRKAPPDDESAGFP